MARYTYTLREVIATFGEEEVKSWFKDYRLKDFLTDTEIAVIRERNTWNEDRLASRIVKHYMNREIGCEGIGEFMLNISDMMQEVMETYAPIIYSASLKIDPLISNSVTETFDQTSDSSTTNNSTTNTKSSDLNVSSDTPQGQISKDAILRGDYATSTSANEGDNEATSNSTNIGNGNEHYTRKTEGNSGRTMQELVDEYRRNIRAIDTEIVYALEPLFMSIK